MKPFLPIGAGTMKSESVSTCAPCQRLLWLTQCLSGMVAPGIVYVFLMNVLYSILLRNLVRPPPAPLLFLYLKSPGPSPS